MEEILGLIGRYWWIVGIVILRVIVPMFRKKQNTNSSGAGNTDKRPAQKSQLQEYLEKMRAEFAESEDQSSRSFRQETPLPREVPFSSDEDDSAYLGHVSAQPKTKPKKVKPAEKKKPVSLVETYQASESTEAVIKSSSAGSVERKSFPENLDYLPPMQRAFVFSEIFGSPKGLD
jgi:hypothetical protein